MAEDEHVDQRLGGGGCRDGEDHCEGTEEQADDGDGDERDEGGEADGAAHDARVDHVALELADDDKHDHRQDRDVDRLREPNGDDEETPATVLSKWLINIRVEKIDRPSPANLYQGCIYAWNAYRDGKSIPAIRDMIVKNFYTIHD